jgi:hypothetical protein
VKRWRVEIDIDEHAEMRRTYARARLHTDDDTRLQGTGWARRNARDVEVPEVGDELAAARALTDLAAKLRDTAAEDVDYLIQERGSHGW